MQEALGLIPAPLKADVMEKVCVTSTWEVEADILGFTESSMTDLSEAIKRFIWSFR